MRCYPRLLFGAGYHSMRNQGLGQKGVKSLSRPITGSQSLINEFCPRRRMRPLYRSGAAHPTLRPCYVPEMAISHIFLVLNHSGGLNNDNHL